MPAGMLASDPMAKDQAGQPKKTTVKVDPELLRKARHVSIHKGQELQDYVDGILRPAVERDYSRMIREEAARED